jgi:hypothetical protein
MCGWASMLSSGALVIRLLLGIDFIYPGVSEHAVGS